MLLRLEPLRSLHSQKSCAFTSAVLSQMLALNPCGPSLVFVRVQSNLKQPLEVHIHHAIWDTKCVLSGRRFFKGLLG